MVDLVDQTILLNKAQLPLTGKERISATQNGLSVVFTSQDVAGLAGNGGGGGGGGGGGITVPFSVSFYEPNPLSNPNLHISYDFNASFDTSTLNPGFTTEITARFQVWHYHGQNTYQNFTPFTQAKTTPIGVQVNATFNGSGQKFALNSNVFSYGYGDSFLHSDFIQFAGCNIGGDEGQGFWSVSWLRQQDHLTLLTVVSVAARSAVNATTTVFITGSKTPQSVPVTGTLPAVGDWVVIDPDNNAPGLSSMEAVQVTAVGVGSFTAQVKNNHAASAVVLPALVMQVQAGASGSISELGQDRTLVNLTNANTYSTGTVNTSSGIVGSGTTWTNTMAGGDVHNVGAWSFDPDTYSGPTSTGSFASTPLRSWYPIKSVNSATSITLGIDSPSGSTGYSGAQTQTGTYIIRPSARVLHVAPGQTSGALAGTQTIICGYSAATWNVNDSLELAIGPNPSVAPMVWRAEAWTPGALTSNFITLLNSGVIRFDGAAFGAGGTGLTGARNPTARSFAYLGYGYYLTDGIVADMTTQANAPGLVQSPGTALYGAGPDGVSCVIQLDGFIDGTSNGATGIYFRAAQGTGSSPSALTAGSSIGGLFCDGYSSSYQGLFPGRMRFVADENWTASAQGTRIEFYTTPDTTTNTTNSFTLPAWGGIELAPMIFSQLPAASASAGSIAYITDSNTAVIGANITAGLGSNKVFACSKGGSNWIVMA